MLNYTETVDIIRNITSGILVGAIDKNTDLYTLLKSVVSNPDKLSDDERRIVRNLLKETNTEKLYFMNYTASMLKQLGIDNIVKPSKFNEKILDVMKTYENKEILLFYYLPTKDLFENLLREYENEIIGNKVMDEYKKEYNSKSVCGAEIESDSCGVSMQIGSCGINVNSCGVITNNCGTESNTYSNSCTVEADSCGINVFSRSSC